MKDKVPEFFSLLKALPLQKSISPKLRWTYWRRCWTTRQCSQRRTTRTRPPCSRTARSVSPLAYSWFGKRSHPKIQKMRMSMLTRKILMELWRGGWGGNGLLTQGQPTVCHFRLIHDLVGILMMRVVMLLRMMRRGVLRVRRMRLITKTQPLCWKSPHFVSLSAFLDSYAALSISPLWYRQHLSNLVHHSLKMQIVFNFPSSLSPPLSLSHSL